MKRETGGHIRTARRNRDFAHRLLDSTVINGIAIRPPPLEWAAVAAFYSAVHYVNAFLWETLAFRPSNHDERTDRVYSEPALNPVYDNYTLLSDHAWKARYYRDYRIPHADIQDLLHTDLAGVESAVESALGVPHA